MVGVFVGWAAAAIVLLLATALLGWSVRGNVLGILIDARGRYSLTQLQLVLWTIVILSLVSGVFVGRVAGGLGKDALAFSIPNELLVVLGISAGSAATSTIVKSQKDQSSPQTIAASAEADPPRFAQVFLVEEGSMADRVIDVTKFQNLWITLILVGAYVAMAITTISGLGDIGDLKALPGFSGTFVTLLGISHAAYVGGKLPNRPGNPVGLSLDNVQDNPVNPQPDGTPRNAPAVQQVPSPITRPGATG